MLSAVSQGRAGANWRERGSTVVAHGSFSAVVQGKWRAAGLLAVDYGIVAYCAPVSTKHGSNGARGVYP